MLRGLRKASSNWLGKVIMAAVVGFLVMLGCAVLVVTGWRKAPKPGEQGAPGARRQVRQRRSMMDRIEQRWQRRRSPLRTPHSSR